MSQRKRANRITIAEVAEHAGVSSMTVSRVINRDAKVKSATRDKVEAAIAELNYAPNTAARSLAGGKIRRICLLYGNPSSAYLGELLLGALEAVSKAGAHLIVERTTPDLAPATLEERLGRDWDALIIPPPMSDIAGIRTLVRKHDFPTAFISSAIAPGHANEIRIDDELAAYEMTRFLIGKGHERIGFIKGHPNQTVTEKRYAGYMRALDESGLEQDLSRVVEGLFTYRSGEQAGMRLLSDAEKPTAIFASNDDMAAGVLAAAGRLGLSVPSDLSIVGFDDSPIASTVWPPLTTVSQPVAKMAAEAVQAIVNAPTKTDDPFKITVMPHQLIERDSVSAI